MSAPGRTSIAWLISAVALTLGCGGPAMTPSAEASPQSLASANPSELAPLSSQREDPGGAAPARGRLRTAGAGSSGEIAPLSDEGIHAHLVQVSQKRGLPILRPVKAERLGRSAVIARIKAKVDRELPPQVLQAQGELLGALGLIPPDYDFMGGIYSLLEEQVAGFYDPEVRGLVLLDDLSERSAEATLAHELVHGLQDQHFDLEARLKYRPGNNDRVAAAQTLSEGGATSAMYDVVAGSAFNVPARHLRTTLVASMALSGAGADIPRVLQSALIAPYTDGFALVQALRERGGWPAVDAMWRDPPASTEQVLHLAKYDAREPPIQIPVPPLEALGEGWQTMDHDVLGEQGLRVTVAQWGSRAAAAQAAAGWGGDRYVVAKRPASPATNPAVTEYAAGWVFRFDSNKDAIELADVLARAFGKRCRERPMLGAVTWLRRGDIVVLAAGPYRRTAAGARVEAPPSCARTRKWSLRMAQAARPSR